MKAFAASLTICMMVLGARRGEANMANELGQSPWRDDDASAIKTSDSFFNPFHLTFPFFGSPHPEDKEGTAGGRNGPRQNKPWFSISDLLTGMDKSDRQSDQLGSGKDRKVMAGRQDGPTEEKSRRLAARNSSGVDENEKLNVSAVQKFKFPFGSGIGRSFPKGLSDFLIIFEKVAPKTKFERFDPFSSHSCGEACQEGACEMRLRDEETQAAPTESAESNGMILNRFDRLFLIIIPVILGIGTMFFILELRRIHRNMKKQAMISTFGQTEC